MTDTDNNETALDFGSGNMVALPSRCLRIAKLPTDCDFCVQACPVQAITAKDLPEPEEEETPEAEAEKKGSNAGKIPKPLEKKVGVEFDHDVCIHCGVCSSICPTEALSTTKYHPKGIEKSLKETSDLFEGIVVGCARALYGIPKRRTSNTVTVPCLAALNVETWFLAASIARESVYDPQADADEMVGNLKVYLPPFICDECPVNDCEGAEDIYTAAISEAEAWGADNIELVSEQDELPFYYSGRLISTLEEVTTDGKRELVEQLAAGFKSSWQSAGDDLTRQKEKAELLAEKRKKYKKSPGKLDLNAPRPFGKKSQRRNLLRTSLQLNESLAEGIELLCADTAPSLCDGCGACVQVCPLNARRRISSNSVLYFGKLPEDERPQGKQAAVTDQLCCLGCSACVQVCPTGACTLTWLNGVDFYKLRQS